VRAEIRRICAYLPAKLGGSRYERRSRCSTPRAEAQRLRATRNAKRDRDSKTNAKRAGGAHEEQNAQPGRAHPRASERRREPSDEARASLAAARVTRVRDR